MPAKKPVTRKALPKKASQKSAQFKPYRRFDQRIIFIVIGLFAAIAVVLMIRSFAATTPPAGFVYRSGKSLMLNGAPYKFVGFNAYGMTGCETGSPWNQAQIDAYFKSLPPASVTRIWAFKDRSANLDLVVARAEANNQKLVMTLGNGLKNCEGPSNGYDRDDGTSLGTTFFQTTYKGTYISWVKTAVAKYKNSPAVAMWEVSNEGGHQSSTSAAIMKSYYDTTAATIKGIDAQHLVSTGALAEYTYGGEAGYKSIHEGANIDVVSFHEYDAGSVSGHFAPVLRVANALNKPLMVGEVGSPDANLCGQSRADYLKARFNSYLGQGAAGVLIWNRSMAYSCTWWSVATGDVTATMVSNYKVGGVVATPPGTSTPTPTTPTPTTPTPTTPTPTTPTPAPTNPVPTPTPTTPGADVTAPGTPSSLRAVRITRNSVTLRWSASTDAVGVKGYRVYMDGKKIGEQSNLSLIVNGLSSRRGYTFTVEAYDAAGNISAKAQTSATTLGGWRWRWWW